MTRKKRSKETSISDPPLIINGWQVFAHPLLLAQLEKLIEAVRRDREKNPQTYRSSANTKVLAALYNLIFREIPNDPTLPTYRQGNTLGKTRRHWFRAKFGRGRFRLFFRYQLSAKVLIFAWVNDEQSLRERGAKTDAYAVFATMLGRGSPPNDWATLLKESQGANPQKRLKRAMTQSL